MVSQLSGGGSNVGGVYQAGLTLYRLFNGDPFYKRQLSTLRLPLRDSICAGRFPNRDKFLPHVPAGIRRVVRTALKVAPQNRFDSAIEFQDSLGRVKQPPSYDREAEPGLRRFDSCAWWFAASV